tara:strand:+ start:703 stop:1020 length:318 start_codon:yes stop_codon:yes gene_type:complete
VRCRSEDGLNVTAWSLMAMFIVRYQRKGLVMSKAILMSLILSGCGCGVSVGDNVIHPETDRKGVILSVAGDGGGTDQCKVAVRFSDNTVHAWVYGFEFIKGVSDE